MATSKPIDGYSVAISSHPKFNEWQANITLLKGKAAVVDVRFVTDPDQWASHNNANPNGISTMYVGTDRYKWFIDLLRNEGPLTVTLYPAAGNVPARMLLGTYAAPVGEGEN